MIAALALAAVVASNTAVQTWNIEPSDRGAVSLRISVRIESPGHDWDTTEEHDIPEAAFATTFQGLSRADLASPAGMKVDFRIVRDAGMLECEGWAHDGHASGDFTVALSQAFARSLAARGIGTPTEDQQRRMLIANVGYPLIDALEAGRYDRPSVADLIKLAEHDVTPDYIASLGAAGIHLHSSEELVRIRDHDVTIDYINGLRQAGYRNLTPEQYVRLRDHDVTLAFVSGMQAAGYRPTPEELVRLRDHDVTPEYVADLARHGYTHLSIDDLIRLRDHGV